MREIKIFGLVPCINTNNNDDIDSKFEALAIKAGVSKESISNFEKISRFNILTKAEFHKKFCNSEIETPQS